MKMTLVTDTAGHIIATFAHASGGKDAPTRFGIVPRENQHVHELDVPEHLATNANVHKLHDTHRIDVAGGIAKLVERAPR
jgi:hypothetical protein